MAGDYRAEALPAAEVALAFPLARALVPGLALPAWLAYAGSLAAGSDLAQPSGIVAARSPRGYIHGLFAWQVVRDLRHDRALATESVVALDAFDRGRTMAALLAAMERIAARENCGAIHAALLGAVLSQTGRAAAGPPDDGTPAGDAPLSVGAPLLKRFCDEGYRIERLELCKRLDAGPATG